MKQLRDKNGLTLDEFLKSYNPAKYDRPSVTVDMVVFTLLNTEDVYELAVLLIKRGGHPHLGQYALPGGFVNMDEELSDAAARELCEETGLNDITLREFGVFGGVNRDPRTRVISAGFYGIAPLGCMKPKAGDDAADASLFIVETSLVAKGASAETYRLTLFGNRILSCRAQLRYDVMGAYPALCRRDLDSDVLAPEYDDITNGLAGDHSLVLFSALCALNNQPRERMARLLTLGQPSLEKRAMDALDRALYALPHE